MASSTTTVDRELMLTLIEAANNSKTAHELRQNVVNGLGVIFECVSCAWTELKIDFYEKKSATTTVAHTSDDDMNMEEALALFNQYAWQHPVISLVIATETDAVVAISDISGRGKFNELELYQEFYKGIRIEDQMSIGYIEDDTVKGISINRATWGFSEDEHNALKQFARCVLPHYRFLQRSEQGSAKHLPLIDMTLDMILTHGSVAGISKREAEVLAQVAKGKSNKQIAELCFISEGTVRKHLENTFRKLGANNRVSAILNLIQAIQEEENEAVES